MPLPREDTTPPVTNTYLVIGKTLAGKPNSTGREASALKSCAKHCLASNARRSPTGELLFWVDTAHWKPNLSRFRSETRAATPYSNERHGADIQRGGAPVVRTRP